MTPLVSVVVIGRNEGARLERCLASVNAMHHPDFRIEVLYADSGSTDQSLELAAALGAKTIALQPARPTAAIGRNAGWRAATGDFILFLDGDTVLHPNFVAASLPEFQAPTVAIVWGHRRELYPQASIYNRVLDLDWVYAPGHTAFCGGDALFRRPILAQTGGFDETLIAGEEPELCRRILALGNTILHTNQPMTGHDLAITHWSQYWRRATRAGHAFAEVAARFAHTDRPFWTEETRRNSTRARILIALPILTLAACLALRTLWPALIVLALAALMVARTAWKARWKSPSAVTLLLYALHSQLQQIPIYVGQRQFARNQRAGRHTALVEYKRS